METGEYIRQSLSGLYPVDEAEALLRLIGEHLWGMPYYRILMTRPSLSEEQAERLRMIVERLKKKEPIQYIIGETTFYNLLFQVNASTLIPRPETEELVELIIGDNRQRESLSLLDIGTGSGCIAVALAKHLPGATVTGVDISKEALTVAAQNAEKAGCENVSFRQIDILDSGQALAGLPDKFDIIVSNPPYIMEKEKSAMKENVFAYEPGTALFVPDEDPLLFYRAIARFGKERLRREGLLYFEINALLGNETAAMLREEGYREIELIKDLSGKDRIIKAKTD
ncbi:release factor glutamine methyltransferase [Parabacteroides sp. PFB2-10]|uniref:peptide chain release factor N(5)-glutamine methyltransferase n=1 Tax=Parabacteroides sp. PFB2-10 TaxID=1742405 RepID=UPI002475F29B|nr:peptide chain release factor N(5)-glutamine methyltransferase [Parabacteroides sp. PFB2-10]MDH6311483.1 release factor glutamine methyltransferase [Parabacteroides sp. PFB2-10]MDL2245606.1 peptide chain release factor N(5)-glutamine methyltransferase [Parabacteroides sp. OttesenSCG-928-J18]